MAESNQEAKDGDRVKGMTLPSIEYDRDSEPVIGILTIRYVEALDYTQYLIDEIPVIPESVKLI